MTYHTGELRHCDTDRPGFRLQDRGHIKRFAAQRVSLPERSSRRLTARHRTLLRAPSILEGQPSRPGRRQDPGVT